MAESDSKSPGQGLDTGTGGFKAEGVDGVADKSLTYDPGATDGAALPTWSAGQINVDKTVKDLTPGTKKTLGAYLSKTTLGQTPSSGGQRPNPYPVLHDAGEAPVDGVLKDSLGYTAPLTPYNVGNSQPHFANVVPGDSRALTVDLTRGLQQPPSSSALSGHALLKDLVAGTFSNPSPRGSVNSGDAKAGPVKTYTIEVLKTPTNGVLTVDQLFSTQSNTKTPATPVPSTPALLAAHLSKVTRGELNSSPTPVDNAFPVDSTNGTTVTKLLTPAGYPSPLSVPSDSQKKFSGVTTGRSDLSSALNILRGRTEPVTGALDGNDLMKGLVAGTFTNPAPRGGANLGSLTDGPVKTYTTAVLQAPGQNAGVLTVEQLFSAAANVKTTSSPVPATPALAAEYLSKVTSGDASTFTTVDNAYPIDATGGATVTKLLTAAGYPSPLSVPSTSQQKFMGVTTGRSNLSVTLNILRGRQQPSTNTSVDGNNLLKNIVQQPDSGVLDPPTRGTVNTGQLLATSPVSPYTDAVLQVPGGQPGDLTVFKRFSASQNTVVPSTPAPSTPALAADYLNKVTTGQLNSSPSPIDNAYPVDAEGGATVTKLLTAAGYPMPLSVPAATQKKFSTLGVGRSNLSNSLSLLRGREFPYTGALDGNELLKDLITGAFTDPAPRGDVNLGSLNSGPVRSYTVTVLQAPGQNAGVLTVEQLFSSTDNTRMPSVEVPPTLAGKANYLSRATKGQLDSSPSSVGNVYPVDNSSSVAPTDFSLTTDGYPSPLSTGQQKFSEISTGRSNDSKDLNILRGREKPQPSSDPKADKTTDGNKLLRGASERRGTVQNPPPPGEVNVAGLADKSPVKYYTEGLVKKNKNTSDSAFTAPENSPALRPAGQLETTTYNGLTPQELPQKKRDTLGKYLGSMTRDGITSPNLKGNAYPIDTASGQPENLQKDGYAQNPHASPNAKKFIGDGTLSSRSSAATKITNYGLSRAGDPKALNGHDLLKTATPELKDAAASINPSAIGGVLPEITTRQQVNETIRDYYGSVGKEGNLSNSVIFNRFNPDAQFALSQDSKDLQASQLSGIKFASKYKMGAYATADGKDRSVTFGKLAQVGNALSIRASTELGAFDSKNNPTAAAANNGAVLPGLAQLGVTKVDQFLLEAKDVLQTLPDDEINEDLIISPMSQSWGSLNNVQDQFAGISAFGMQLLAVAMLVALAVVITLFSLFLLIPSSLLLDKATDHMGRRPYGLFRMAGGNVDYSSVAGIIEGILSGQFSFWRLLGVASTLNNPAEALPIGALAFFGVPVSTGNSTGFNIIEAAGKAILEVTQNPGYYAVMTRTFTRSFLLIIEAFKGIVTAFSAGAAAGLGALLGILGVIRESKFMKGVSTFIQLGDRVLSSGEAPVDIDYSQGASRRFQTKIDRNPNGEAVMKSRLKVLNEDADLAAGQQKIVSPLTLAWASYRAPDMLIMPTNIMSTIFANPPDPSLKAPPMLPTVASNKDANDLGGIKYGGPYVKTASTRIDTAMREDLEAALESEYVPFYLHDLRTNEIVSFHAFLASLSDDYTASYDSVEAMGRVEPVKIYKGTQRKIGCSFYIAATNPQDFNSMWLKINKLTTMVYPQFSEGRTVTSKDGKYVMEAPFSQTIQAAPMVRLRIGDLIRSNYSKFNLARLFGYGREGSKFGGKTKPENAATQLVEIERIKSDAYAPNNYFLSNVSLDKPYVGTIPGIPQNSGPGTDPSLTLAPGLVLKISDYLILDPDGCHVSATVEIATGEDIPPGIGASSLDWLKKTYGDSKELPDLNRLNKKFKFKLGQLTPAPSTQRKIDTKISELASTQYFDEVGKFMQDGGVTGSDLTGNAIARAFRSSGGRGLAGFIESMNFDWYDRVTWEIGQGIDSPGPQIGRRAPKMCKVTLSFSPIHDITPGLDAYGFNRAPIYPVGSSAIAEKFPETPKLNS